MNGFHILWDNSGVFAEGLVNTLILFSVSAVFAFLLACFLAFLLEGHENKPRRLLRWVMDVMRMLPFLIYLYLLYYGLPDLGVRLDVWAAGLIALITYHGAYFAEILRGARASLPAGQAEASYAHGFVNSKMYWRIMLPQMVLCSGPLFGNQLICLIKDTAFLSIITLTELTAAANAVQAKYFIPLPPFVLVIALYWAVTLFVESMLVLLGRLAKKRGLVHE